MRSVSRCKALLGLVATAAALASTGVGALASLAQPCGDLDASGAVTAADALLLLKKAVGQSISISCPSCGAPALRARTQSEGSVGGASALDSPQAILCGDLDASGTLAASDALLLLKKAVGQNVTLTCPSCSTTTTTVGSATSTTIPALSSCGNGVVDAGEQCEGIQGCAADEQCTTQCTCEPTPMSPPSSQELIAQALAAGAIDYPTSLLYRVWALFQAPDLPEQYDGAGSEGEDTALFLELSHARSSLPAEIEAQIAPYLVRPNDPTSIYSQPPVSSMAALNVASADAPPPVGCPADQFGQPDWRSYETDHFVVWSCGGGVGGNDPDATARTVTGAVAEEVRSVMVPEIADIVPDDYPAGPAPQARVDIYILHPNQCRVRSGACVVVPGNALAATSPASPCRHETGSPLTSSAYLLIDSRRVPSSIPTPDAASQFRYLVAHEMFHAISFGLNLEAQGGICPGGTPDLVPENLRSWLSEASAEWASFAFFNTDWDDRRTILFEKFQHERDTATDGLQNVREQVLPYEAFLYPLFFWEESGLKAGPMLNLWLTSQSARDRKGLDTRLDQAFPFADHFRDFAVRNLNLQLDGDPIFPLHESFDPALKLTVQPRIPDPAVRIEAPFDVQVPITVAPLFAAYAHYYVPDSTRSVRFDVSGAGGSENVKLDAIVKVGNTWKRRKIDGPIFEFCREDASDDISELYLVLSNASRDDDGKLDGHYEVIGRTFCPGGWSGSISYVRTDDWHSEEALNGSSQVSDHHERETQRWTVASTELTTVDPYPFQVEKLNTAWQAGFSSDEVTTSYGPSCGTSTSSTSGSDSGSGSTPFIAYPGGPGQYGLMPYSNNQPYGSFDVTMYWAADNCDGTGNNFTSTTTVDEAIAEVLGALSLLTPDGNDPGHYSGKYTIAHSEDPLTGGQRVVDATVEWDLTRREAR